MVAVERWTSAALPGFPDDGKRREIIDGELYVSSQPHANHQLVGDTVARSLHNWSWPRRADMVLTGPGLIFSSTEDVAPDVAWFSAERLPHIMRGGTFYGAPDLVVEMLSPGKRHIARDRETKRVLYSRRGVREYWIADWLTRTLEVYRHQDGQLALVTTLLEGDILISPLLPDFALPLAELFEQIPAGATYDGDEDDD